MKKLLFFIIITCALNSFAQEVDIKWSKPVQSTMSKGTWGAACSPIGKYLYLYKRIEFESQIKDRFSLSGYEPWTMGETFSLFDTETLEELKVVEWKDALKSLENSRAYKSYSFRQGFIGEEEILWVLEKNKTKNDETIALFRCDAEGKPLQSPVDVHTIVGTKLGGGVTKTLVKQHIPTGRILLLNQVEGSQGNIKVKYKLLGPSYDVLDIGEMELPFAWNKFDQHTDSRFKWTDDDYLIMSIPVKEEIQGTGRRPLEVFSHLIYVYSIKERTGVNFLLKMEDRKFSSIQVKTSDGEIKVWGCYAMKDENGESREITGMFNGKLDIPTGEFKDVKFSPFSPEFYERFKNANAGKKLDNQKDYELSHHVTGVDIINIVERGEEVIMICSIQNNLVFSFLRGDQIATHNRDIFTIVFNKYNEMEKISSIKRFSRKKWVHEGRDVLATPLSNGRWFMIYNNEIELTNIDDEYRVEDENIKLNTKQVHYAIMQPNGDLIPGKIAIDNSQSAADRQLKHRNYFFIHKDNIYLTGQYGEGKGKYFALGKLVVKE